MMRTRPLRLSACLVAAVGVAASAQQPSGQPPRFTSSVEVTSIDVSVVDDRGKPIGDLKPGEFTVRVDGNPRRVVSAEWVSLVDDAGAPPPPPPLPDGYSTNEHSTGGRLIVLAVDEPNIRFGGALAIAKAAGAFIDRLAPSDRVAVAGLGTHAPSTPFTADRQRLKQAISRMVGQKQSGAAVDLGHNIGVAEAMEIDRGDPGALQAVQNRECQGLTGPSQIACFSEVEIQARGMGQDLSREGDETIRGLHALFTALQGIEGAKTLVLISEGFVMNDSATIADLGALAASARTSLYVLRLDNSFFDTARAGAPRDRLRDRYVQTEGLETLVGAARGTILDVVGKADTVFERIENELAGYYLIGVESDAKDRDGRSHPIRVEVSRRGAQVRSRRQLLTTPADQRVARTRRQAAAAALSSPLIVSALPLRISAFSLQGPERDRVQVLIHADVGTDYAASRPATVEYVIADSTGKVVDEKAVDLRLLPVMNGVPSPLQYKTGTSLPPGDYTLKFAAAEGDRVGSIEHTFHAVLPKSEALTFSDLIAGGPLDAGELLQPTLGYQVTFGSVHGYFEAYGPGSNDVTVEYEIGTDESSPALLNVDVDPRPAGEGRTIFTRAISVAQLPPGRYLLRAIVSLKNRSVKTLTRGFEVSAPKVLMTSADGLGAVSTDAELFLPVDETAMRPRFDRAQAVSADTLAAFRERISPEVKAAFDEGIKLLEGGDYGKAEGAFKRAIQPEVDSMPGLAYLAVAFAAAGRDPQAAGAFQTALVDGDDLPQIYDWLGAALMRTHDYGAARAILEEAVAKWPADRRFIKPLAMLYATFGRGREAVRTLERYLADRADDVDAHYYAVQWLYTVHAAGAVVHTRAQDLQLARDYAAVYERAGGAQLPLVKQWLSFLEGEK